jgi:hypothetical protein
MEHDTLTEFMKHLKTHAVDTLYPFSMPIDNPISLSEYSTGKGVSQYQSVVPQNFENPIQKVFYQQAYQHKLTLDQVNTLVDQRQELHDKHLREIQHRHLHFQESLSIVQMNKFPDWTKQATNLERVLLGLEENKRNEEIALWKDTLELHGKAIEETRLYKAITGRANFLAGGSYDR